MKTFRKICTAGIVLALSAGSVFANTGSRSAPQPYQVDFEVWWNDGSSSDFVEAVGNDAVPEGKRLVLSNVNYQIAPGVGQTGHCLLTRWGGGPALAYLPAPANYVESGATGTPIGFENVALEVMVDEGDYVVYCNRSGNVGTGVARVKVTGVLISN